MEPARRASLGLKIALAVFVLAGAAVLYQVYGWVNAVNPDPNHTHADFAVWVDGKQLDFSGEEYMTGESADPSTYSGALGLRKHLHLHDGVGHVIHRHKPGLTIGDFFASLGVQMTIDGCLTFERGEQYCDLRMFINGIASGFDPEMGFGDLDQIHITNADNQEQVTREHYEMTDDACKYSKTCPWRGSPPAENCIADPEVPCVVPEGDL